MRMGKFIYLGQMNQKLDVVQFQSMINLELGIST